MNLLKQLHELEEAGIITAETAGNISAFYENRRKKNPNRLLMTFGILGSILAGLGLILIIAHNWDQMNKTTRLIFAFLPLIAGQVCCGIAFVKKVRQPLWSEASAAFTFLAIGACISLVSQIYHINGNMGAFLRTWLLLGLPLIYLLRSGVTSLIYIAGCTWYAIASNSSHHHDNLFYWPLMMALIPFLYRLYKEQSNAQSIAFHNWIIPFSLVISLGTIGHKAEELLIVSYTALFTSLYAGGDLIARKHQRTSNGFMVIGWTGNMVLLFILSFDVFWEDLRRNPPELKHIYTGPEIYITIMIAVVMVILMRLSRKGAEKGFVPYHYIFPVVTAVFLFGFKSAFAAPLINIFLLLLSLFIVRKGAREDNLTVLNSGLIIIAAQVTGRFFDNDLSFVVRGTLFFLTGCGFLFTNLWMIRKRTRQ